MIIVGDCVETMRGMADNSVDAVVTDPPYGLSKEPDMAEVLRHWLAGDDYNHKGGGFMGKAWDSFVPGPVAWCEVLRVLKPGGHALVFAGTRTQDLMSIALRLAGFQIRDSIRYFYDPDDEEYDGGLSWIYGSGFPKSLDVGKAIDKAAGARREVTGQQAGSRLAVAPGQANDRRALVLDITAPHTDEAKQWDGWGTALKPAYEPIIMARKPMTGTVADNVLTWGTGAINIEGCRVGTETLLAQMAGQAKIGTFERQNMVTPERSGRWPANIIHDGSAAVLAGFPDSKGQQGDLKATGKPRPSSGRFGDMPPPHEHPARTDTATSAVRFFYCAKTSKADRNDGCESLAQTTAGEMTGGRMEDSAGLDSPRAGAGCTGGGQNNHPTVKPTELMRYLCRLITPPGGTVFDPYAGSGSTGKAAILEGFNFMGCELSDEFAAIARARIDRALIDWLEAAVHV